MSDSTIEDSAAPLMEHLIELRSRLVKSLIAIAVIFVLAFIVAEEIFQILVIPYERAAGENQQLQLIFTAPQEFFFAQLKIAFFTALFVAFPVIATQVYRFVAPDGTRSRTGRTLTAPADDDTRGLVLLLSCAVSAP